MKLPDSDECGQLIEKYEMPQNIKLHTQAVRSVANFLAKRIAEKQKVDLDAVDRGSLLHDLLKMHCIKNDCRHAQEASRVLSDLGYDELGKIVALHNLEDINYFDISTPIEAKIIWYADKRVNHDKIVSLQDRYEYLKERYGSVSEQKLMEISATEKKAYALEKELLGLARTDENLGGLNEE